MYFTNFLPLLIFFLLSISNQLLSWEFLEKRAKYKNFYNDENVLLIASIGRSGSTMLTEVMDKYAVNYKVVKTHLLPPEKDFTGKILFIFSNPDLATESLLHHSLLKKSWGLHFRNMESSDRNWLKEIGGSTNKQTLEHNLLNYDAIGLYDQLNKWMFYSTQVCEFEEAQILALKYENLWDPDVINEIKKFLNIEILELPKYRERGAKPESQSPNEIIFINHYNVGTTEVPIYTAYDKPRQIWENAPSFQYFKLRESEKN